MPQEPNMKIQGKASALVMDIGRRAQKQLGLKAIVVAVNITKAHLNGCRLRLQDLLEAPDRAFAETIEGIMTCLDPATGQLKDGYVPAYADTLEDAVAEGRVVVRENWMVELCLLFRERSEALTSRGPERDKRAVEFFCGAASLAVVLGSEETARNIGQFVLLLGRGGYPVIEQLLAMPARAEAAQAVGPVS